MSATGQPSMTGAQPATPAGRSASVDLLRIGAMFLIVTCHSILHVRWMLHVDQGFTPAPTWKQAAMYLIVQYGQVGVSVFFIVTGYFLIRKPFTFRRPVAAWAHMWVYAVTIYVVGLLAATRFPFIMPTGTAAYEAFLWSVTPGLWGSYWFMTAYLVLLLLSPYINHVFLTMSARMSGALIALLAFFSLWLLYGNRVGNWTNVVYAALGYMIGAWIRLYRDRIPRWISARRALWGTVVASSVVMLLFNRLSLGASSLVKFFHWDAQTKPGIQILPIVIAAALFLLTIDARRPLRADSRAGRAVISVSASMFGVYLIHENTLIYRHFWPLLERPFAPHGGVERVLDWALVTVMAFVLLSVVAWVVDHLAAQRVSQGLAKLVVDRRRTPELGH